MAITFTSAVGSANSKVTGTTLVIPTTTDPVAGALAVVLFASDDAAGTFSIADDQGNTWVECKNQLNSGNVRTIVWASLLTTTITGNITITHPSLDARAGECAAFAGVASATPDQTNAANATAASGVFASGSITPSENNELLIGGLGWEGVFADGFLAANGFVLISGTNATSGGGAASNIGVSLDYQIQTTATADNFDDSMVTGRDNAACVVSFKATPSSSPSFVPPPSNTFWNAMQARSAA